MALLLSAHLFHACTHTNIFLMSLFFIFSIHQHCCESSLPSLITCSIFSSFPTLCYHLIPPSYGILYYSISFLSIPIVPPTITTLKRDATKSWNMFLFILYIKQILAWKKYPAKIFNAQRLFLHHSWDFVAFTVMFNLRLKQVLFFTMLKCFLISQRQLISSPKSYLLTLISQMKIFLMKSESFLSLHWQSTQQPLSSSRNLVKTSLK